MAITSVHGEVSVNWFDNVCVSTLSGAFNEEGISNWFLLLQRSWTELGKPERWAHVLDMYGWQGRTPETTPLVRQGVAWTNTHGLSYAVIIMEQGPASIFIKMNQTANPVIPASAIEFQGEQRFVYLLQADSTVRRQAIQLGEPTQAGIPVLSGLKVGEQLVVEGLVALQDGARVKVLKSASATVEKS